MAQLVLTIVVGLLAGVAIGFQNPLTSLMAKRIGALEGAFVVHLGGTVIALVPLLALRGGGLGAWRSVPWYALGAGALGLVFLSSISYTIPRVGVAATVALIVAAQLGVSVALDHFGVLETIARPLDVQRAVGITMLVVGAWLVLRP